MQHRRTRGQPQVSQNPNHHRRFVDDIGDGLLGINVGGLPGTESPYAFTIASVSLVAIALGLAWFRRRRLV